MQFLAKIPVLCVALLYSSCTPFETADTEESDDFSWVAEARENLQKSQNATEHELVSLRSKTTEVNPFEQNETWSLYRIEGRIYGVRTEAGKVTGELIADDATIVGPWVRAFGVFRTSGERFKVQLNLPKDYADIQ